MLLIIIVKTSYFNYLTISLIIKKLHFAMCWQGKSSVLLLTLYKWRCWIFKKRSTLLEWRMTCLEFYRSVSFFHGVHIFCKKRLPFMLSEKEEVWTSFSTYARRTLKSCICTHGSTCFRKYVFDVGIYIIIYISI